MRNLASMRGSKNTALGLMACLLMVAISGFGADISGTTWQVFELNNRKGIKDSAGKILIPARYEEIGWSNGSMEPLASTIGYKTNGFWGITSLNDTQITGAVYRDLYPLDNGYVKASRSDSYEHFLYFGILDTRGAAVVGFQYYDISPSGNNYIASRYENRQVLYGLISSTEKQLIPFRYKSVSYAGGGMYKAVDHKDKADMYSAEGVKLPAEGLDSLFRVNREFTIVTKEGKLGLMRNDGTYLLEPFYKSIQPIDDSTFQLTTYPSWHLTDRRNTRLKTFHYDDIETIGPNIYKVSTFEGDALINISGQQLSNKSNWEIIYSDDDFVISKEQGKFRVYNKTGEPFLGQLFDSLYFDSKYFYTLTLKNNKPLWDVYNTFGRKVTRFSYHELKPEGSRMIPARRDDYWGFLDFNGGLVIDHKFDKARVFVEGMAAVEYLGKWGVIDLNGNWLLQPKFDYCEVLNKHVILTKSGNITDLMSPGGEWLYTSRNTITRSKSWLVETTPFGSVGLLSAAGERITTPEFEDVEVPANDSTVFLRQGGFWWVYAKNGKQLASPADRYQQVSAVSESYFRIVKDNKYGFVDMNNKLRIANQYEDAQHFSEGLAAIKLNGRWGFVDKIERLIVQPVFDTTGPFTGGLAVVSRNGKYGIITKDGSEAVGLDFDEIRAIDKNTFLLRQGDQYGFYYRQNAYLMMPRFNQLQILPNGLFVVEKRGNKGLINEKGIDVIPSIYADIHYDLYNAFYLCMEAGTTETFVVK